MISAVIVAAGRGTRMGPNIDKIFLEVAGHPIIAHTWKRFDASPSIDELIFVVREGMASEFQKLSEEYQFTKSFRIVHGGKERQDSVANGLAAISSACEYVAIHDGARPCVTEKIITDTVAAARQFGAAIAATKVTDTLKESDPHGVITRNVDRSKLWAVQTPQIFKVEIIRKALRAVAQSNASVTDDAAACEFIGQPVKLVESETPNPKATSKADLPFLELLLKTQS